MTARFQKGFIVPLIVAIVAILALGGIYYLFKEGRLFDWTLYTNTQYGFELRYPPEWQIDFAGGENPPWQDFELSLSSRDISKPAVIDGQLINGPCSVIVTFSPRMIDYSQSGLDNPKIIPFSQYVDYLARQNNDSTTSVMIGNTLGIAIGDSYYLPYKNDAISFMWNGYEVKESDSMSQASFDQNSKECTAAYQKIISTFKFTN